jgi:pimeloyl-ACP methyl ester carboxylesterase
MPVEIVGLSNLSELTAGDGEFSIGARHWTGFLRFGVGESAHRIELRDGAVVGVAVVPTATPFEDDEVGFRAAAEVWEQMLEPEPRPHFHGIMAARREGMEVEGSEERRLQYFPAIRRLIELLRGAQSPSGARPSAKPPRPAGAAGRFDAAVGRYVYLHIDGVEYRVYFEEAGPVDGIPVLLQHTAGADGRQWRHFLEAGEVTGDGFRLIAYDLPYHGKSVPPEHVRWWSQPYVLTRDFLMQVPIRLAEALGLERPVYMGSSIGGHLAADLARYHPECFRAVIGLEAGIATPSGSLDLWHHPRIGSEAKAQVMYELMAPSAPEAYRHETSFVYSQGAPPTFKGDLYYYCIDHDLTGEADKIDTDVCEVHLLTGEYDYATDPDDSRRLAEQIKGSTFVAMAGLGHFPMAEDPDLFLGYIRPVLAGIKERLG